MPVSAIGLASLFHPDESRWRLSLPVQEALPGRPKLRRAAAIHVAHGHPGVAGRIAQTYACSAFTLLISLSSSPATLKTRSATARSRSA